MEIVERAKVRLEIEDEEAKVTLESLKSEAKEINKELKGLKDSGEVGSEAWKELKQRQKEVNAELKEFTSNIDINDASMNELRVRSRQLSTELNRLKVDSDEWLAKLEELKEVDGRIDAVKKSMKDLGDEVEKQPSLWENMKTQVFSVFTGVGLFELAKEATSQMFEFGKEVFNLTAKFEKYEAVLRSSLGSQKEASEALEMIQIFAAKTNFSVDELTESYIKMANRDLRPNAEQLMHMADVANATGKDMGQLVEAIMDINNTERWNEIGIKAQTMGDKVSLTFKGQTEVVARTEEGVMKAMDAFGQMNGVMGMTAEISATLEGRTSNLGDNYDTLKRTIGESLKPVFDWLLEALNIGIETTTLLVKALFAIPEFISQNIGIITGLVVAIGTLNAGNIAAAASALAHAAAEKARVIATEAAAIAQRALNLAMAVNPVGAVIAVIALLVGAFMTWYERSEKVKASISGLWQALKSIGDSMVAVIKALANADFSGVVKAFGDAGSNASSAYSKGYSSKMAEFEKDKQTKQKENHKKEVEEHGKHGTKTGSEFAKKHKAERDKLNQQIKADNEAIQKKIEDMQVKSIADDTKRAIAQEDLDFKREKANIEKSLASEENKRKSIEVLEKLHKQSLEKINEDHEKKLKAEKEKKEADDLVAKNKKIAEENKLKEEQQKQSKLLFDTQFNAEIAKLKAKIDLTKENSKQELQAKKELIDAEWKYKQLQLKNQADAEKARINESIKDAELRNVALQNIDEKLKANLITEEKKFETNKTNLIQQHNKQRAENNKQFFESLNAAMRGDFNGFMNFLSEKVNADKNYNQKRLKDFTQKTGEISDAALQGINTLKQLNQQFLESQLSKIKAETSEQIASWEKQYNAGRISKEQFEAEKDKINQASAQKEKQARKDAFEREKKMNLAAAVINTAQSALKSMAMFGFPVGAIMAALAVVAGGVQIAAINRQKFEGRLGGMLNSEGKIFARSGANIPKNAFVSSGDRHGSKYGESGISMINRRTGEEVGEIEGGEPVMVLSRNTYKNNGPIVDKLLKSSLYNNGAPITMASGGVLTVSGKRMYQDGGILGENQKVKPEEVVNESKSEKELAKIREFVGSILQVLISMQKQDEIPEFLQLINDELKKSNVNLEEIKKSGNILHLLDRVNQNTQKSNL